MATNKNVVNIDDSFSTEPITDSVPIDDSFSAEPIAIDDSFSTTPIAAAPKPSVSVQHLGSGAPSQSGVGIVPQMGVDKLVSKFEDPFSDEDAQTYLDMSKDLSVPESQIASWLAQRGKIWGKDSSKQLAEYREAVKAGKPTRDDIEYTSIVPELLPQYTPEVDPTLKSGFDASLEAGMAYNPMGIVSRLFQDWTDADLQGGISMDSLRQKFPGLPDDAYEAIHDGAIGEWRRRELLNAGYQEEAQGAGTGTRILGNVVGGTSPLDIVPIVRGSKAASVAADAVFGNMLGDAALQAGDVAYGAQDSFNYGQNLTAGVEGGALGLGIHGLIKGAGALRPSRKKDVILDTVRETSRPAQTLEEQAAAFKGTPEPTVESVFGKAEPEPKTLAEDTPEFLKQKLATTEEPHPNAEPYGPWKGYKETDLWPTEESKAADLTNMEQKLAAEAEAFKKRKELEAGAVPDEESPTTEAPTEATVHPDRISEIVTEKTDGWKNKPEVEIVNSVDEIADPAVRARMKSKPTAKGVYGADGKVRIIAGNITDESEISAILYHEALGHHGVTQLWQNGLDATLEKLYNSSAWLKEQTDNWIANNPGAYADSNNLVARAADEVLARMSEDGPMQRKIMDVIKNYLKNMARKYNFKAEFSEREIRSILAMAHDAVIKGTSVADNGFSVGDRFYGERKNKSTSIDTIQTTNDLDDLLDVLGESAKDLKESPMTIPEMQRETGLTPTAYLKKKSFSEQQLHKVLWGGKQALTDVVQQLSDIRKRIESEGFTPSLRMDLAQKMATARLVYARFENDAAEVGRSLRLLREIATSRKQGKALERFMTDNGEGFMDEFATADSALRFLDDMNKAIAEGGTSAGIRKVKQVRDVRWEDYASSILYNARLSSPETWLKNFLGAPFTYIFDNFANAVGYSIGKLPWSNKVERIRGKEVLASVYGPLMAYNKKRAVASISRVIEAAATGQAKDLSNSEGKLGTRHLVLSSSKNKVVRGIGKVTEIPQRVMSATDEFWGRSFHVGNLYSEAARKAAQENLSGPAFKARVEELVDNPTPAMESAALAKTNKQLFRDYEQGSRLAKAITKAQSPDVTKDSQAVRGGKFAFKASLSFVPTLDSVARQVIKNSGPLGLFSGELRSDLMAGGARRHSAMGRLAFTSALIYTVASMAGDEDGTPIITGAPDPNFRREASNVYPPYSIRLGAFIPGMADDEWTSYKGYDPISSIIGGAVTAKERALNGEDVSGYVSGLIGGTAQSLLESTWANSAIDFLDMLNTGTQEISKGLLPTQAGGEWIIANGSSLTPNFVRWANSHFSDEAARDTTGDKSFGDRFAGRVKSAIPGWSKELPQKVDVFGRPMENVHQKKEIERDPAIIELSRLAKDYDGILLGPVRADVRGRKLSGAEVNQYQQLASKYMLAEFRDAQADPEWNTLSKEQKQKWVYDLYRDARAEARKDLFDIEEEPQVDGEEEDVAQ